MEAGVHLKSPFLVYTLAVLKYCDDKMVIIATDMKYEVYIGIIR